jgi:hypothetical protein
MVHCTKLSLIYTLPILGLNMILLTGGAGYIGSHAAIEFIKAGYRNCCFR